MYTGFHNIVDIVYTHGVLKVKVRVTKPFHVNSQNLVRCSIKRSAKPHSLVHAGNAMLCASTR